MLSILNNEDISTLDRQIEQLIDFKPIPEHEVKMLCEKVRIKQGQNRCQVFIFVDQVNNEFNIYRQKKFSLRSRMSRESAAQSQYVEIFTVNSMT